MGDFCGLLFSRGAVLVSSAQPGARKGAEVRHTFQLSAGQSLPVRSEWGLHNLSFSLGWIRLWPYVEFPVKLPGFLLCTGMHGQESSSKLHWFCDLFKCFIVWWLSLPDFRHWVRALFSVTSFPSLTSSYCAFGEPELGEVGRRGSAATAINLTKGKASRIFPRVLVEAPVC